MKNYTRDVLLSSLFIVSILFPVNLFSQEQQSHSFDPDPLTGLVDKCGVFDPLQAQQMLATLGDHWGYGYDSLLADLGRWVQSPYVSIDSLGASVQNRALWQLTITSDQPPLTPRRTVFLHARTHPNEVQAWWVTDELINLLLSEDPFAQFIRSQCVVYIIPMYNPDGVELEYPRQNANGIDIESNWNANPVQPEVAVLRSRFTELMTSAAPIEVALNMHSAYACTRYFVYHDAAGTSPLFTTLEQDFIGGVRSYYPGGIQPWNYFVSWTGGTPTQYPESWFWLNFAEAVMALTYEDMNCTSAGNYDLTAYALLHGVADYLGLVQTAIVRDNRGAAPAGPTLAQSYPNPVQLSAGSATATVIQYELNTPQRVRLAVYDILGRRIAVLDQGFRAAQTHRVFFDASRLATGMYFYRLETAAGVQVRQLSVVR